MGFPASGTSLLAGPAQIETVTSAKTILVAMVVFEVLTSHGREAQVNGAEHLVPAQVDVDIVEIFDIGIAVEAQVQVEAGVFPW